MALSQLLGGWTKWGWPRVSGTVFLLGFLPALVAGGLVLLHAQPDGRLRAGWAGDLGLERPRRGLVARAAGDRVRRSGSLFGFTFDTTGPRRAERREDVERRDVRRPGTPAPCRPDGRAADEPVAARARVRGARPRPRRRRRPRAGTAATRVDRDHDGADDREQVTAATRVDRDATASTPRRGGAARREDGRLRLAQVLRAAQAHEEEDRAGGDHREDQRRRTLRRPPRSSRGRGRARARRPRAPAWTPWSMDGRPEVHRRETLPRTGATPDRARGKERSGSRERSPSKVHRAGDAFVHRSC